MGYVEWDNLARVVVIGLVIGAGLPTLFAIAVRSLAGPGAVDTDGKRSAARVTLAVACFAVVVAAICWAIAVIATHR